MHILVPRNFFPNPGLEYVQYFFSSNLINKWIHFNCLCGAASSVIKVYLHVAPPNL